MIRLVLLFSVASCVIASAAESVHVCPAHVSVASQITPLPEGWEVIGTGTTTIHQLLGATFADGHPKGQAFLKPYKTDRNTAGKKSIRTQVYRFPAKYPDGIWLVCTYRNTPMILSRQLLETPRQCSLSQETNETGNIALSIDCR